MVYYIIILLQCIFALFYYGCKKEPLIVPPEDTKPKIILTLQDTTCTEAWLQLQFKNLLPPHNYKIYRDSTLAFAGTLFTNDTTFIDTTLLPQRQYGYKLLRVENNVAKDSSKVLQIKTMDTTSHDFSWTMETIGYQFSNIRDVAIVNDTLAYAVGLFYEKDTSIGSQIPHNVARWNGKKWELVRVFIEIFNSPPTPSDFWPDEIEGIYVFNPNDIWLTTGVRVTRWDGKSEKGFQSMKSPSSVQSLWGLTPNNIFGSGRGGSFVHYNGTTWTKYDSLTNTTLTDIYGTRDGKEVWATGWDSDGRGAILRWKENSLEKIYDFQNQKPGDKFVGRQVGLWIDKSKIYFAGTNGFITTYNLLKQTTQVHYDFRLQKLPYAIHGSSCSNIFIVGDDALVAHWNGNTWKSYPEFINSNQNLYSISTTKNLVIAVGMQFQGINRLGYILIGKL